MLYKVLCFFVFSCLSWFPLLYQILYQTVPQLSANSCCLFLVCEGTSSTEDLRSVWLFRGILVETRQGPQGGYERLRSKGSEKEKR